MGKNVIPVGSLGIMALAIAVFGNKLAKNIGAAKDERATQAALNEMQRSMGTPALPAAGGSIAYITKQSDPYNRYVITSSANIGRYPHNDYQIVDPSVSRVHCRIFLHSNGTYYLTDMDAKTKSRLNGVVVDNYKTGRVEDLYMFPLRDGDRITVGNETLIFHLGSINSVVGDGFAPADGSIQL